MCNAVYCSAYHSMCPYCSEMVSVYSKSHTIVFTPRFVRMVVFLQCACRAVQVECKPAVKPYRIKHVSMGRLTFETRSLLHHRHSRKLKTLRPKRRRLRRSQQQ